MPHSFREWEDFLFHFETGKEGFRLREARGEEGESERGCCFRSYSKARSNASCWHEQGTEGEWIYSIGFQRKQIQLATLKIHRLLIRRAEQKQPSISEGSNLTLHLNWRSHGCSLAKTEKQLYNHTTEMNCWKQECLQVWVYLCVLLALL